MGQQKKTILHIAITILIMLFIFLQSALPADLSQLESGFIVSRLAGWLQMDEGQLSWIVRKGAHFTEYLILGVSLFLTVRDLRKRVSFWIPWAAGAAYAVTDELHQAFVPGRSCELRDMLIDACGVLLGVALMYGIKRRASARSLNHIKEANHEEQDL